MSLKNKERLTNIVVLLSIMLIHIIYVNAGKTRKLNKTKLFIIYETVWTHQLTQYREIE